MSETVEITRYPNRRLYDRSRKKYVTVGDIESMIINGEDVCVRDSKSQEDLTRVILTQIILERHPERIKMFPVAFLHAILRADQFALNWMTIYFGQALTFLERVTSSRGAKLVPGIDFLQSLLPNVGKPTANELDNQSLPTDDELQVQQEMAVRMAEMERRLAQLESESPASDG
jgi:polyhydroxyalkanoate synthesis repressor PhaR